MDELIELTNIDVIYPKQTKDSMKRLIEFEWNCDMVNNLLPIGRDQSITFDIVCFAKGNFVKQQVDLEKGKLLTVSDAVVAGSSVLNKKSQVLGSTKLANFINEFQSRKSSSEIVTSKPVETVEQEEMVDSQVGVDERVFFCCLFDVQTFCR